jgi:drug/metabolite transporter (DMT)-like permease
MNIIGGLIIAMVGTLFITWGRTKSNFGLYRLLVARSRVLWGDRVHGFYQVAGALMIIAGAAIAVTG